MNKNRKLLVMLLLFLGLGLVALSLYPNLIPGNLSILPQRTDLEKRIEIEILKNSNTVKEYFQTGKIKVLGAKEFLSTNSKHIENLKKILLSTNKKPGEFILEIQILEDPEDSLSFLKSTVQLSLFSEKTGNKIWEYSIKISVLK